MSMRTLDWLAFGLIVSAVACGEGADPYSGDLGGAGAGTSGADASGGAGTGTANASSNAAGTGSSSAGTGGSNASATGLTAGSATGTSGGGSASGAATGSGATGSATGMASGTGTGTSATGTSATTTGGSTGETTGTGSTAGESTGGSVLPPTDDYGSPGPFPAQMIESTGPDGQFTMFRPRDLDVDGMLFSPLTWGNGIATWPALYREFLTNVASHGFVIIASNSIAANETLMRQGLEWLLAQNDVAGELSGKLDVNRAVSMGYSIGGTAAVLVGAHPSVVTTVSIHGHTARSDLHGPLLQTTGTDDTIGVPLQQATYDQSSVPTFLATLSGATHFEILEAGGGREGEPIIAWLRLWVYDDQNARPYFYGSDCTLCKAPWTNPQRKNGLEP